MFMAVAIDDDIDLHPKNKRLPASRLGWAAANLVYGQEDKPLQGPQLTEIQKDGSKVSAVDFCKIGQGLCQSNGHGICTKEGRPI